MGSFMAEVLGSDSRSLYKLLVPPSPLLIPCHASFPFTPTTVEAPRTPNVTFTVNLLSLSKAPLFFQQQGIRFPHSSGQVRLNRNDEFIIKQ